MSQVLLTGMFQQHMCMCHLRGKEACKLGLSSFHVSGVGGGVREVVMHGLDEDLGGGCLDLRRSKSHSD